MVNNRLYGQVLTYGSSVKWGWHQGASSLSGAALNYFMDAFMTPNELYLPPLGHASVGFFEPTAGTNTIFHIGPTNLSIGADFVFYLICMVISKIPDFGKCYSLGIQAQVPLVNWSVSSLRNDLVAVAGCVEQAFPALVAAGTLNSVSVGTLSALFSRIEAASLVANGIALAGGVTWKIGDLVADWIVNHASTLCNGFSVYAKTMAQPTTTPVHTPQPQPTPSPTSSPSQPVDAYSNYGPANAGHAMCRGNHGNSLSMPGGTASQMFTVPTGVASLSSDLVQIDPDSSVTAHLSVAVNGNIAATADAAAAGDTRFVFGPVSVNAGDTITLTISFTATYC